MISEKKKGLLCGAKCSYFLRDEFKHIFLCLRIICISSFVYLLLIIPYPLSYWIASFRLLVSRFILYMNKITLSSWVLYDAFFSPQVDFFFYSSMRKFLHLLFNFFPLWFIIEYWRSFSVICGKYDFAIYPFFVL